MTAQILTWSRSRGVFAGLSLTGATLRQDLDSNRALYGKLLENRDIVRGSVPPPPAAKRFLALLSKYSPRKG
jgi:lipid-binding SYLF domain-containing protein